MQTATAPAPQHRAGQTEFDVQGRVRYLFSPRRIDVRERETGHLFIEPKQFVQITDKYGRVLDMSQEAYVRKEGAGGDGLITSIKTSMKIVDELLGAYGDQGVVYLTALDNLPQSVVVQIEQTLLPDRAMKLPAMRDHLLGLVGAVPSGLGAYQRAFDETRTALLAGIETAIEWCRATVASARNEYEGRMRGEVGIPSYSPAHKLIAAEINEKLEEGQNINIEQVGGGNGDITLLAQTMMQAVTQMGQQTNAVLTQLAQQQQQNNALLMQLITGKPLPPTAIVNPDAEGEGEPLPDSAFDEDTPEPVAPVAASVQPPKRRSR